MRPLASADLRHVRAVFTDVDGTLTSAGQLTSTTLRAIEWLRAHRISVVLVSGRPSGWGECWARQLPVDGVIVENGGLYFARRGKRFTKVYVEPASQRLANRRKLERLVKQALTTVRGAKLSMDSSATEVDLAIDYAETANLGHGAATKLETFLHSKGVKAVRSSVHVNCWLGDFDKRTTVERFLKREWGARLRTPEPRYVYVGDSFNDEPLFEAFSLSVGVANVRDVLERMTHAPRFVTRAREGRGFGEVADAVVRAQRAERRGART